MMAWYWYAGMAVAHLIFAYDFWLEMRGTKTISDRVWDATPSWIWYAAGIVGFNACFWLISGPAAALFLGAWLLGHFSQ